MRPIYCPETSAIECHYSLRNNPEERSSFLISSVWHRWRWRWAAAEVTLSSRSAYRELTVRLRRAHGQVKVGSRSCYGQFTVRSRSGHGQVKVALRSCYGQATVSSQSGHGQLTVTHGQVKYTDVYRRPDCLYGCMKEIPWKSSWRWTLGCSKHVEDTIIKLKQ